MSSPSLSTQEEDGWLRRRLDHPHFIVWFCMGVLIICAWMLLGIMAYASGRIGDGFLTNLIASLCSPTGAVWTFSDLGLALAMWLAMTCAMMLPAGAPMLATYMDISGAAARKQMKVPDPAVLMAGYLGIWGGFAVAATLGQWGLASQGVLSPSLVLENTWIAGGVLVGAGLWQFSETKHACLTKCRRPFTWFMANWRDDTRGVFKMGLRQGLICLGCCWALMLVMFVTGLMNLFWMAGMAIVMVAEKTIPNPKPLVYGTGLCLIVGGAVLIMNNIFL